MMITWKHSDADFPAPTFEQKVDIFYHRHFGWQIHIADILSNGGKNLQDDHALPSIPDSGFVVLQALLSYFETAGLYHEGYIGDHGSRKHFKIGVRLVFQNLDAMPNQADVETFLDRFYEGARCGLYHSSITMPGIGLGLSKHPMAFNLAQDVITINPHLLPKAIKAYHASYCDRLFDPNNAALRQNFETRFNHDSTPKQSSVA